MRPVRFVAVSEDGHALVLADEVGRLLALPLDERLTAAIHPEAHTGAPVSPAPPSNPPSLSPRDIQARIRAGESAEDVARIAGVPVDRVLRYAGPVLQERAMLAQHARRTRLATSDTGASLSEVIDGRLAQHGVDADKISWDAYRREDGTWRVVATWPSGKATAQAVWELDRARNVVSPVDDMAVYLCTDRSAATGKDDGRRDTPGRTRKRQEASRGHALPVPTDDLTARPDPIRSGRDALLASLERPLGAAGRGLDSPAAAAAMAPAAAASEKPRRVASPFDDDSDAPKEVPAVPSLAVLRPRRSAAAEPAAAEKPSRKRAPSWDEVLFGSAPAARESS